MIRRGRRTIEAAHLVPVHMAQNLRKVVLLHGGHRCSRQPALPSPQPRQTLVYLQRSSSTALVKGSVPQNVPVKEGEETKLSERGQ